MPESYPRAPHLRHAAPEDELIRLEHAYEEIAAEQMRRIRVTAPTDEPHLTAGDPT